MSRCSVAEALARISLKKGEDNKNRIMGIHQVDDWNLSGKACAAAMEAAMSRRANKDKTYALDTLIVVSCRMIYSDWENTEAPSCMKRDLYNFMVDLVDKTEAEYYMVVHAVLYLKRLREKLPQNGQRWCSKRLFLVALLLGQKYLMDEALENTVFSEAANLTLKEVNRMERELLLALNYSLSVSEDDYARLSEYLRMCSQAAKSKSSRYTSPQFATSKLPVLRSHTQRTAPYAS
eukprot:Colp12_sorted_trinity150504_noHs@13585